MLGLHARRSVLLLLLGLGLGLALGLGACASLPPAAQRLKLDPVACDGGSEGRTLSAHACVAAGGQYTPADGPQDFAAWLALAKAGDAVAQGHVGRQYEAGVLGAAPDFPSAASWYRQAMQQDHLPSMLRYASLLERGLGVRRNPDQARALLRRATQGRAAEVPPRFFLVQPSVVLSGRSEAPAPTTELRLPPQARRDGLLLRVVAYEERVRTVRVDGRPLPTDRDGYLRVPPEALGSARGVQLEASDSRQQTTRLRLAFSDAEATPPALPAPGPGRRLALLIANAHYRHHETLATPTEDARAIAALLARRYGYQTELLLDVTRPRLLQALVDLRKRLSPQDELLIFYAGHGEIDPETGRGHWIPVDARPQELAQWVSNVDVADQLRALPARRVMLIVDSCFGGTLNTRALPAADADLGGDPGRSADERAGPLVRVAMSSGAVEPVADGDGGRHSLYAQALIDVLGQLDHPLSGQDFASEVHARVLHRTRALKLPQEPRFGPVRVGGHREGDFRWVPVAGR